MQEISEARSGGDGLEQLERALALELERAREAPAGAGEQAAGSARASTAADAPLELVERALATREGREHLHVDVVRHERALTAVRQQDRRQTARDAGLAADWHQDVLLGQWHR